MSKTKNLAKVDRAERFLTKHGSRYFYHGKTVDLTKIDTATAEALANDPGCMFLQWADAAQRPEHQRKPMAVPAGRSSAPPAPPAAGKGPGKA